MGARRVTVLVCSDVPGVDAARAADETGAAVHAVGPRPKKQIDALLDGRVVVVGDDADVNAVVLRLLRKDLLADVTLGYVPGAPTGVTRRWCLPTGAMALRTAATAPAAPVTLVRSDAGGVLIGEATIAPMTGNIYVDADRILFGTSPRVTVRPGDGGVAVTVARRKLAGLRRFRTTTTGRAVEFGLADPRTAITYDGITHPRSMNRWVFYAHTSPLHLVSPAQ